MEFRTFDVPGLLEIRPRKFVDERGYFAETLRMDGLIEHSGPVEFVQDNQSLSVRAGTVRGLHFQTPPMAQGKLVRCLAGSVYDVAVDLRRHSPTYGRWTAVTLSPDENNQLYIPPGFAHGFCTLAPNSVIGYRVTAYYSPAHDTGVAWDDPDLAVDWPAVADPDTLSDKDRRLPAFVDLPAIFVSE